MLEVIIWYNKLMFGKVKSGQNKKLGQNEDNILSAAAASVKATVAPDQNIQDRIVAYFANGKNAEVVTAETVTVAPEQREGIQAQIANGQIKALELGEMLLAVNSPLQEGDVSIEMTFQRICESPRQKQILAVATGYNANNWQNVSLADLKHLLAKPAKGQPDYQTPIGFAKFRAKFIEGIAPQATPEQLQEYERAMDDLEVNLYGKRFEYYKQILLMDGAKAVAEVVAPNEDTALNEIIAEETQATKATVPVAAATEVAAEVQPLSTNIPGVNAISAERSNEILNRAIINGDPWKQGGNEYRLGITNLLSSGLTPAYEMTLDGQSIVFSAPFQLSDGRGAILAYVITQEGAKVRGYYLNTKTGLWHYAPDMVRGAHGEGMGQIGEAYGASSTMLPVGLQNVLAEMVKNYGFREITTVNPDFLFAGTMMAYNTQQEYRETLAKGQMRGDFYTEVDKDPIRENWQMVGKNKNVPQLISVNANLAPNFSTPGVQFATYSILAGQLRADSFPSQDGQAVWLFCSDEWGRAWLGNIEIVSPLTSTGCRRDWMKAGDLATPLYEYSTQAASYGDPNDTRKGLVGMWNQYLSKIPLLQEYIAWRNRSMQG